MITNIVMYILQILNLGLLFKVLLGYEVRTKTGWIVFNITLFMMGLILRCAYWDDMPPLLGMVLDRGIVIFPIIVFKGDVGRLFLISIVFRRTFSALCGITVALGQLGIKIDDIIHPVFLTQMGLTLLLVITYICTRRWINRIHRSTDHINRGMLLLLVVCLSILGREFEISINESEEVIQLLIGQSQILSGIIVIFFVIGAIVIHWIGEWNKQLRYLHQLNQKYIEEQTQQYKRMEEKDQALRRFHHDYKAHLNVLQKYLQKGRYTEASAYLAQLEEQQLVTEYISTGNLISDAIINQCAEEGRKYQIEIDYHGIVPSLESIKEIEFCALFANAISNAYEAAMQVSGRKKIVVRMSNNEGYLFIYIKNPAISALNFSNRKLLTAKKEKEMHGIGTRTMKEIVERNQGSVQWIEGDG